MNTSNEIELYRKVPPKRPEDQRNPDLKQFQGLA